MKYKGTNRKPQSRNLPKNNRFWKETSDGKAELAPLIPNQKLISLFWVKSPTGWELK